MSATDAQAPGTPQGVPDSLITQLEWLEFQHRLRAIDLATTPAGAVAASRQVVSGGANVLCGWAITESTGAAPASIRLRDGASANGQVIARIDLAASESTRDYLDRHGIRIETGMLWLEVVSGSVEGVLWLR